MAVPRFDEHALGDSRWPEIPRSLDVSPVFGAAYRVLLGNYGVMLGAVLVVMLFVLVVSLIASFIDAKLVGPNAVIQPVSMLMGVFVVGPLYVGPALLAAMRYRAGPDAGEASGSIDTVFLGYSRYQTVVTIALVISVINWVPILAVGILVWFLTNNVGIGAGALVGVVLGIPVYIFMVYVYIRLGFATLLSVDPLGTRPTASEALRLSWEATSGHAWMLFALGILFGLVMVATMLLLVLPAIFFGLPFFTCGSGVMYMIVAGRLLDDEPVLGQRGGNDASGVGHPLMDDSSLDAEHHEDSADYGDHGSP